MASGGQINGARRSARLAQARIHACGAVEDGAQAIEHKAHVVEIGHGGFAHDDKGGVGFEKPCVDVL